MKQFFYCLATLCILVGTSLALPRPAGANPTPGTCNFQASTLTFIVGEDPEATLSETASCSANYGVTVTPTIKQFDVIGPNGLVSDYIDFTPTIPASTDQMITITSDPNELGLPSRGTTQKTETIVSSSLVNNGAPGLGVEFPTNNIEPGSAHLIIFSDFNTGELAPVPEPSTGLLSGAALPMLFGIRRFAARGRRAR